MILFCAHAKPGIAPGRLRVVRKRWVFTVILALLLLLAAGMAVSAARQADTQRYMNYTLRNLTSPTNLLANPFFSSVKPDGMPTGWEISGTVTLERGANRLILEPQAEVAGNVIVVQPGARYRYALTASTGRGSNREAAGRVRLLWLNRALQVVSWDDAPLQGVASFPRHGEEFVTGAYTAPSEARHLRFQVANLGAWPLSINAPYLESDGVYVEQHPNGADGAIAFSFDWESAMGGAIHSTGMEQHDPLGAAEHGLRMRQGADWLNDLFIRHDISATFYATGYNLLNGNTEHRLFSGDPTYKWASRKNHWSSDYWTAHPWFGDDPYGTYETDPAWYFGDQTRKLLAAGHEIGVHTFGHLYVRGSNPAELAADLDEWLAAAVRAGAPPPTTFAFPWRSSNSVKADMYSVLYEHGIRSVTRLYAPDLLDLYTLSAVKEFPQLAVMPDFLLGAPAKNVGEEAGGAEIGLDEGLTVITETLQRRGTTSFWTHPEQLASDPSLEKTRRTWQAIVEAAAQERDRGRLWIAPVGDIAAYQTDLMSVTTKLDRDFLGFGGWKITVTNNSGKALHGVTLTLPGDVRSATSAGTALRTVLHSDNGDTRLSEPGKGTYPARQLVFDTLKPSVTLVSIEWEPGQEPPR